MQVQVTGRAFRFVPIVIVAAFATMAANTGSSVAQQPQSPPPTAQQPQSPSVSAFLANPDQLLQQNPNGGSQLSNAVQALALADPSTFKALLGLTAKANDPQKSAIGAGLAQATKIEVLTNQALATDWQQQIASITDPSFKIAATDAFGDVELGSIGGAVGAPGSGLGGPGNGPTSGAVGSLQNIQSNAVTTRSFALTSSISGAVAVTTAVSP